MGEIAPLFSKGAKQRPLANTRQAAQKLLSRPSLFTGTTIEDLFQIVKKVEAEAQAQKGLELNHNPVLPMPHLGEGLAELVDSDALLNAQLSMGFQECAAGEVPDENDTAENIRKAS